MSSHHKPGRARVRRTQLPAGSVQKGLVILEGVCDAGRKCMAIGGSQPGRQTLEDLRAAVTATRETLTTKQGLKEELAKASRVLRHDAAEVATALLLHETTVAALSRGDGAVMRTAGFAPRGRDLSRVFGAVTGAHGRPGTFASQSLVTWPAVPFASTYAMEVCFTPDDPAGAWSPVGTDKSRRRVVNGPAPAARILVRVAAFKRDGTRSDWSAPILIQTR